MSDTPHHRHEDAQLQGSQRLTAELKRLYLTRPEVPEEIDDTVRLLARRRFAAGAHVRGVVRWLSVGAAAAAALLVVLWGASLFDKHPDHAKRAASPREAIAGDVDASGEVDILDAFALARTLEEAGTPRREWDLTGDGIVNRDDVDAVAMSAVRLREERLQ